MYFDCLVLSLGDLARTFDLNWIFDWLVFISFDPCY